VKSSSKIIVPTLLVIACYGIWLGFNSTENNRLPGGIKVPDGMVFIPGGQTLIGKEATDNTFNARHQSNTGSPFVADVDPFFMDKYPVTVAQFREFIQDTGFNTEAERFGNAAVFDKQSRNWILLDGANWEYPRGPNEAPAPDNHPVTQISWNDAVAYANWAGKRLPSEIEWEHAARGAVNNRSSYAWNKEIVKDNNHSFYANIWQGDFPIHNSTEDGYEFTSPVGAFGETELGLADMGGNVWEWCQDWYLPYSKRNQDYTPNEYSTKVQRGGSFQCNECEGYTVYARSHTTPETSLFHVGFRTVKDLND
jgi:sulfatase modifying factor 1